MVKDHEIYSGINKEILTYIDDHPITQIII